MKCFPDVVIIYEHKARELFSSYLLKYELQRRGIQAWVCHNSYRHTWWMRLLARPGIVISLGALTTEIIPGWTVMDQHSLFLRGRPRYYINLQAEQMFRDNAASYNIVKDKQYENFIYYVCWGEWRRRQVLREGIAKDHIWVTGALQLDFCRTQFDPFFLTKKELAEKYGIDEHNKWVLLISSFPYVTYSKAELEWGKKIQDSCGKQTGADVYDLKKTATATYLTLLDWMDRLLSISDIIFIYRLHPGERKTDRLKKLLQKYPKRFLCISEGSIHQWIRVCDFVDTWVSTAYSETVFSGKKCNIIQPYGAPEKFEPVFYPERGKISTFEEFVSAHKEICKGNIEQEKKRLGGFYQSGEKAAFTEICDRVQELLHDRNCCCKPNRRKIIRYLFTKAYFIELYVSFALTFKLRINFSFFRRGKRLEEFNKKLKKGGEIYEECHVGKNEKRMLKRLKKIQI